MTKFALQAMQSAWLIFTGILLLVCSISSAAEAPSDRIDFNRDIRSILSNNCFQCHGPDEAERKGGTEGLRLDTAEGAQVDLGGYAAIVPGKPEESELVRRITAQDTDELMPPPETGKKLSAAEIQLLVEWVRQGAAYERHWAYVKPVRHELPKVQHTDWPKNPIDYFILARLEKEQLAPSPEADRYSLIRRVSLDLTGLPPTLEEVEQFVQDESPQAYERLVERLLAKEAYGEHWARLWLDLARYADSAGYADDPPRTIWAYRDYVIRSFNANKPFDVFTIEQLAGDLLPNPTDEQLIATAFHRNTLTNNEGGTNDEEFRNVAVVDRVNTTMAVWMGTTIACAQCHSHKYDPITQEEYFRFFAFFNNTADADRQDESPILPIYTAEQREQKTRWEQEISSLKQKLATPTPALAIEQAEWEKTLAHEPDWRVIRPVNFDSEADASMLLLEEQSILVGRAGKTDTYTLEYAAEDLQADATRPLTAVRLETLPHESLPEQGSGHGGGNFVISRITAAVQPPGDARLRGRYVRIEMPGEKKILSLAEVQVFSGQENIALQGAAQQSSTAFEGPAQLAIDGNPDGRYYEARSTTHTAESDNPWWELDLKQVQPLDRLVIWNRTDNDLHTRLKGFRIAVLDDQRQTIWEETVTEAPNPSFEKPLSGLSVVPLAAAYADYSQSSFDAQLVVNNPEPSKKGWAVGGATQQPHRLALVLASPLELPAGSKLVLKIEQQTQHEHHTLGHFRVAFSNDAHTPDWVRLPPAVQQIVATTPEKRSEAERAELSRYFLAEVARSLEPDRTRLAELQKQLADMQPATSVPIMRELPQDQRRTTHLQFRGNYLDKGQEVSPGVPETFHALPDSAAPTRLALAGWLVDENNPLTARVIANRYWEQLFGGGLVRTSEEFGSQGELPSHPELLDWLAVYLVDEQWDLKQFLRLLVTSATYRQSSRVTPELWERDPDNRLLARGPRFRMSAEMVRDQALFVSGLLSRKMHGPPVKPPQPKLGLSAAFGSGIDWQASTGADRYRRGLYTTWRRSSPYPSMLTFDAPNREVCTVRRDRTNTPLQALVTLNDPVYVETAQALARRVVQSGGTVEEKAHHAFRLCLIRPPSNEELNRLVALYETSYPEFQQEPEQAVKMATDPLGAAPEGSDLAELAAWTVVGNVLLNLDEMFMKP